MRTTEEFIRNNATATAWTGAPSAITLFHMDKPTHHDVDVILKLYELRREERMRKARGWLFGYRASSAAEHQAACPPGSEQDAYYRMVTSYWDMAASFVSSGAINKELFLQSAGELLFVWEKTKVDHWRHPQDHGQSQLSFESRDRRAGYD